MPTNINFNKKLGITGGTQITLPSSSTPFSNSNSFSFDGVDEYFDGVGTYSELDGQNNFTFSFWIKPTNLNNSTVVFSIGNNSSDYRAQQFYCYIKSNGQMFFHLKNMSIYCRSNGGVISANVWQHVLICRKSSAAVGSKAKIFVNSVDVTNTETTRYYTNTTPATTGLMIGEHTNSYLAPFLGKIDEFAIWSGTDQRANVSEIYNGGVPNDLNTLPTAPQPTTWHRMGENATWNGSIWAMTDVNGSYISNSVSMVEANRTTDVPPNPSFANTKSILLDGMDDLVSFSQVTYTGEFTTSFWMKPVSLGNNRFLVGREANSDYVWLKTSSEIRIRINFSTYIFSEGSGNDINTGAWNHLLISRDSSNNVSIFLNGASFSTSQVGAGNHRLDQIGKVGANYYDGNIDETAFWDSDQSSNLATIYNSGVPNDISSLSPTLWYRMGDGDTAPTLTDNGSGGNDGTMVFFNTFSTDVPT